VDAPASGQIATLGADSAEYYQPITSEQGMAWAPNRVDAPHVPHADSRLDHVEGRLGRIRIALGGFFDRSSGMKARALGTVMQLRSLNASFRDWYDHCGARLTPEGPAA
jgi:hypothetical protein